MVFLPNLGVNRRDRLGGIPEYASAQSLERLDLGQKSSFLNWKRRQVPIFKKTITGWALNSHAIGFPDEHHVFHGILVFYPAIIIVIETNLGYVQLDQAP